LSIFKSFILSVLASSSLVSGGDDGWFPVAKAPKAEEESTERDPSIWVLFSKTIDLEKILVRLPEDPSYSYTDSGNFQLRSERDGETFELIAFKAGSESAPIADSLYELEGKWVHEHVVQSEQHVYLLRTSGNEADSPHHQEFVSSFSLQ
jgi:hypothetical protein